MNRNMSQLLRVAVYALGLAAVACSDPFAKTSPPPPPPLEDCATSTEWLPNTPPVALFEPLPHPTTECPFYRGGWQNFLIAMQPIDSKGTPALLQFPTIDTGFTPKVPHPTNRSFLGDIKQAGKREIVIDQNGNTLYYGIHMNQAFVDFIHANKLDTAKAIQAYPDDPTLKNLFFPAGVAEFKSAWQLVEGDAATIAAQTADYVSMVTTVPTIHQDPTTGEITEDRDTPRTVTVRLLAIHVVFTLPGHPEFVWASFEHTMGAPDASAKDGKRNVAPTLEGMNPSDMDPTNHNVTIPVATSGDYLLYKLGTAANEANASIAEKDLHLDATKQKFLNPSDGSPQQTSIYRMFAASKSNTVDADDAVTSLNNNVEALFAQMQSTLVPNDKRGNYRLLGAQWMDKPRYFILDSPLQNDQNSPMITGPHIDQAGKMVPAVDPTVFANAIIADGSDSEFSILAGEDRMSSTAMESFTQPPGGFNNCFTCHNTQSITANGVPLNRDKSGIELLKPGLLNVSHVISQFVLEECGAVANQKAGNDAGTTGKMAVCP
jgi:hypothetical protein